MNIRGIGACVLAAVGACAPARPPSTSLGASAPAPEAGGQSGRNSTLLSLSGPDSQGRSSPQQPAAALVPDTGRGVGIRMIMCGTDRYAANSSIRLVFSPLKTLNQKQLRQTERARRRQYGDRRGYYTTSNEVIQSLLYRA